MILYDAAGRPLPGYQENDRMTEVVRSYSMKLNLQNYGGNSYESVDLFASQKKTCRESEAEDASLALYAFCRAEVLRSRSEIVEALRNRAAQRRESGRAA